MISFPTRQHLDPLLLALPIGIALFGVVVIGSATGSLVSTYAIRQAAAVVLATLLATAVARANYRSLAERSRVIYIANLLLLTAVMVAGDESKGAQRWIGVGFLSVQPSEFAKVALIITLGNHLVREAAEIDTLRGLVRSLLHMSLPMLLIFKQPDLGTSLVLMAIWFAMTAVAGAQIKHLAAFLLAGTLLFGAMWHTGVLKPYQKNRLVVFLDPTIDPRGSGYHIQQSRIAIGSGRETGKGLFRGTQKKLRFVPERHTDFIFTVVGEELGFAGSALVLFLYWLLLTRGLSVCLTCEDLTGQLMAVGVVAMFTFHTVVNVGMTLGIMPVTGVPLPLLSFGGSSMVANAMAVGLLISIHLRRHKIMF